MEANYLNLHLGYRLMLVSWCAVRTSIGVRVGLQNLYPFCSLSVINRPHRANVCAVFMHACSRQVAITLSLSLKNVILARELAHLAQKVHVCMLHIKLMCTER